MFSSGSLYNGSLCGSILKKKKKKKSADIDCFELFGLFTFPLF